MKSSRHSRSAWRRTRISAACAARGAPQLEAGQPAEREQRLTHGAGGALHQHALSALHPGRARRVLVGGRPAQDQCGRLRCVDTRRHTGQAAGPECAIGGVRPEDRHIGYAVAHLKAAHALAELIDFPNDVIAQHQRRPAVHRLRVEVAPDHDVGVLQARGEHADPHLAPAGCRQGSVDHLQLVGIAEATELNNPVVRLADAVFVSHTVPL